MARFHLKSDYPLSDLEKISKKSSIVTFPVLILLEFVFIICQKDLGSLVSFALNSCINVCFSAALALFIITLLLNYGVPVYLEQ